MRQAAFDPIKSDILRQAERSSQETALQNYWTRKTLLNQKRSLLPQIYELGAQGLLQQAGA